MSNYRGYNQLIMDYLCLSTRILESQENMEVRFPPCNHAWSQRRNISDPFTIGIATMIYIYMDSMDMEIWNDMDQNLVPQLLNGGSSLKRLKSFKSVVFQVFNGLTQAIDSIDHPRFRRATIFQLGDVVESSHVYVNYIYTILYTYIYIYGHNDP